MMAKTNIEWTHAPGFEGATWNPTTGCSKVSSGCANCYAEKLSARFATKPGKYLGVTMKGKFNGTLRLHEDVLDIPLRRRKPTMYFVNSMSDLFHEKVPFDFIDKVFAVMALCPQHTFQVLTKRPERMAEYLSTDGVQHRIARAIDVIEVQREIDAMPEEWRLVGGYPQYQVSNHGRVRGPGGLLSPDVGEQGHSRVTLFRDGIRGRVLVHRLVLRVWKDQARSDDEQVRHRNGNPTCNALPNLFVGTQADNWDDAKRHGSHRRYSKLSPEDVRQIRERAAHGESAYSIAKDYPVSDTQIRNILTGNQWSTDSGLQWPLPRVWLGTSVEDQKSADERIPHLLRCPPAVRFLSVEPLLGLVGLDGALGNEPHNWRGPRVDWVIVGGESGPGARPCNVEWIRSIVGQCKAAAVPCFVKQLGKWIEDGNAGTTVKTDEFCVHRFLMKDGSTWVPPVLRAEFHPEPFDLRPRDAIAFGLSDPKGGNPSEWPADLRVREWPA